MAHHQTIFQARVNGSSSGQFVNGLAINVHRIIQLLEESSAPSRHASIRRASNALLEAMAQGPWRVSAGPHKGGRAGDPNPDLTRHITVSFGPGRSYHLRLDQRGHLFQITDPGGGCDVPPWRAPGT